MNTSTLASLTFGGALLAGAIALSNGQLGNTATSPFPVQGIAPGEAETSVESTAESTEAGTAHTLPNDITTEDAILSLSLSLDQSLIEVSDTDGVAMIQLSGQQDASVSRSPVAMAIVVDTSGSMSGEKITNARESARRLVNSLENGDMLTIISYDSNAEVLLQNEVLGADRSRALAAVNGLNADGSTCMSCGMDSAYAAIAEVPHGYVARSIVFSDGHANRGVTDPGSLNRMSSDAHENGIVTSTLGVGDDYNEFLMQGVATSGTGNYYFVHDSASIGDVLTREMSALSQTIAHNVVVEIEHDAGVSFGELDAMGAARSGDGYIIRLGQFAAGENRRFMVPLALAASLENGALRATVRYEDANDHAHALATSLNIARTDDPMLAKETTNSEVLEQWEIVMAANEMADAMNAYAEGRTEEALDRLDSLQGSLAATAAASGSAALMEEAEQVERLRDFAAQPATASDDDARRSLRMQNSARANEMNRGAYGEGMFHSDTLY